MRVISTHLPDEKKEKGKGKIYRVGGENCGGDSERIGNGKVSRFLATRLDRCASRFQP